MKFLVSFLTAFTMLFLISCGSAEPDNKIYAVKEVEKGFAPTEVGKAPAQVVETFVTIKPTWGQANEFASQRGDSGVWSVIAFVLLACFTALGFLMVTDHKALPQWLSKPIYLWLLAVLWLVSWKWQAAQVKWNNDKPVPKTQFDYYMNTEGSTKPIWDSLSAKCLIIGGKYDCFKK